MASAYVVNAHSRSGDVETGLAHRCHEEDPAVVSWGSRAMWALRFELVNVSLAHGCTLGTVDVLYMDAVFGEGANYLRDEVGELEEDDDFCGALDANERQVVWKRVQSLVVGGRCERRHPGWWRCAESAAAPRI